jgi:hypothetical protein
MDIFKTFATDPQKELNGAWVDLKSTVNEGEQKPRLLIARLGNRLHSKLMTKLYKQHHADLNSPDDDLQSLTDEKLNVEATARTILLGWEGIEYAGKKIAYSFENAVMLLNHADFRNLVLAHARNFEYYRAEQEQAAKKD